jgi:cell division protein FtsW (lipid II flippase)
LGKLGIVKPKFVSPLSIFNKPFDLGSLLDWWNNPSNKNIIKFFIGTEYFVPESATIFKNTKVPQIKVNVPQDFLTAYNEIQAENFQITDSNDVVGMGAFFGKGGKGYIYSKTANGYVLSKIDQQ